MRAAESSGAIPESTLNCKCRLGSVFLFPIAFVHIEFKELRLKTGKEAKALSVPLNKQAVVGHCPNPSESWRHTAKRTMLERVSSSQQR